jgi:hypothetical protein
MCNVAHGDACSLWSLTDAGRSLEPENLKTTCEAFDDVSVVVCRRVSVNAEVPRGNSGFASAVLASMTYIMPSSLRQA